jgi:hypothetical protein
MNHYRGHIHDRGALVHMRRLLDQSRIGALFLDPVATTADDAQRIGSGHTSGRTGPSTHQGEAPSAAS